MISDIRGVDANQIQAFLERSGQPRFRLNQILNWLYVHRVQSWEEMSNLPTALRSELAKHFALRLPDLQRTQGSLDTTQKFLWRLNDNALVESVMIPANPALYGERSDRKTLCISTQVGCAYGCRFCASGLDGWRRNLLPEEIVGQVLAAERTTAATSKPATPSGRAITNIVVMGMGEPMANYDNLIKALRILNAPWGGNIGARKITISTSGLAPQIRKLSDLQEQFGLAISLHAGTDEVRDRIMPVNRKYPLSDLIDACESFRDKKNRTITLEYILISGVNDGLEQIEPLSKIAKRLKAKVNLIPYNQVDGLSWERPSIDTQESFLAGLEQRGVKATLRREKGHDIDAACGQLRLKEEKNLTA